MARLVERLDSLKRQAILFNSIIKGNNDMETNIQFGKKYKDIITGYEGIATGWVEYLSGCNQVLLAAPVKEEGALINPEWFDIQRIQDIESGEAIGQEIAWHTILSGFELGKKYHDRITGFKGIAIGRAKYINRNYHDILLAPQVSSEGERREAAWIPESMLILETIEIQEVNLNNGKKPGCDRAAPKH